MKTLTDYLTESLTDSLVLEFKNDMKPFTVIVMGGPGAGKTKWIDEKSDEFFKIHKGDFTPRQLDSDNNLTVVQRENCDKLALNILNTCKSDACSPGDNAKQAFYYLMKDQQAKYDENSERNGSPKTDLSKIKFKFCKPWWERLGRANDAHKQQVKQEFKVAFAKEYFKDVFASDFSSRHISKEQYKKEMYSKLKGVREIDSVEFNGNNDCIVAITGDNMSKIDEIVQLADGNSVVVIVYLNVSEEIGIANDAKRDRHVGAEMVRYKLKNIHKTWDELSTSFEQHGIYRMYEMLPSETVDKDGNIEWVVNKQYINKSML